MSDTQLAWALIGLAGVLMVIAAAGIQYQLRKIRRALRSLVRVSGTLKLLDAPSLRELDEGLGPEPTLGYMCRIDFEEELGRASGGNTVFASPEDCARCRQCTESCGMVEVEVRCVRTVLVGSKFDGTDPLEEDTEEPT